MTNKSPSSTGHRIQIYLTPQDQARLDLVRGGQARSAWIRDRIQDATIQYQEASPAAPAAASGYAVSCPECLVTNLLPMPTPAFSIHACTACGSEYRFTPED